MKITDTHCHLYLEEFDHDIEEVISRARAEGVGGFYLPNIDSEVISSMLALESRFPGECFAMMGLHPCSVKEKYLQELDTVSGWLAKRRFVAMGEIGLDFYWDLSFEKQQYEAFYLQVEWALQYDLSIVIHSRNALKQCIDVVREKQNGKLRGVFHCFSGTKEEAQQIMDLGFYLGIGGVITYKNSSLPEVMKSTGLDYVVLETDAPYLAPAPFRGKRNESSYLRYVIDKLSTITGKHREEIVQITTNNAGKLFDTSYINQHA